ncbi:hypothetical protein ABZ354_05865 [Streptomyces sp. NPDC005925]|uniref:hypothetical protein n=1 Tax=Streptomyces sp. NPDC005925 TaxID=3157172 RepID=UPI00340B518B
MITASHDTPRLLPWTAADGRPCYLVGDGHGHVSRVADSIESVQLGMAGDLLDHAADMLADQRATAVQLRFLAARLAESLRDVRRVAESRGARLPSPPYDPDDPVDDAHHDDPDVL